MTGPVKAATALMVAAAAWLDAAEARACTPSAERVVAWNAEADLAVAARWTERDRPPAKGAPAVYELRRLSTGATLGVHECGGGPCEFAPAFAKALPPARWKRPGPARGALRVTATTTAQGLHEWALEARGPRGWRRVAWLDFLEGVHVERRRYTLVASERAGDDVVLAVQYHSHGGNCSRTMVQVLRLREKDLRAPSGPDRREHLLAHVRQDTPLPHWRTTAELGPLPAGKLLEVLELADGVGRWDWGARWWREAIAALPPTEAAALTAALRRHPGLHATRALLGMAPDSSRLPR